MIMRKNTVDKSKVTCWLMKTNWQLSTVVSMRLCDGGITSSITGSTTLSLVRKWVEVFVYSFITICKIADQDHVDEIHRAARYLQDRTCLKFVFYEQPVGQVQDYIYVHGDSVGCAALVGRRGGPQRVRLQPHAVGTGCFRFGTVLHEFIHALGFHHMQNVYDRDNSIRINWENVRPDRFDSFDTRPSSQVSNFAVPYDVGSLMHYSQTTSSANGLPTMTALFNPHNRSMGQRIGATPEDILRINRMYNCPLFP